MKDLIERQAALDALGEEGLITAMVIIDRIPSWNVEVVQCEDCKQICYEAELKGDKA